MKSIRFFVLTLISALCSTLFAQKTYTFDDGVALETDWTVVTDVPSGGTAQCEITQSIGGSFSPKDGNYLGLAYKNKGNIKIEVTTKQEYKNITSFGMDVVAGDNGKPTFAAYIVDANGNVLETLFDPIGSKDGFATGGTNKWGHKDVTASGKTGYIKIATVASSSGKFAAIDNIAITYSAGPSDDATLKSLTYDGTSVPDFSPEQENYDVELPAGTTVVPKVEAVANDDKANVEIIDAAQLPGTTEILVTAEKGNVKTYKITFTVETANPKVLTATWDNIRGTAKVDNVNMTITGQVLNGSSLSLEPQFTGKYLDSWIPEGPQDFSNGSIDYTFRSATSEETKYTVEITEAPEMSTDASLKSLTYGGQSVPNFSPTTYVYNIELTAGIKTPPEIAAVANDEKAKVEITQAPSVPGVGKVVVTAEDETVTQTYTINYTVKVPPSGLTTHVPEIYEARIVEGGYATPLVEVEGREYEVYYASRTSSSNASLPTKPGDKVTGIEDEASASSSYLKTKDGWFEAKLNSISGGTSAKAGASGEFSELYDEWRMSGNGVKMDIQGFDQFCYYAADKSTEIDSKTGTFKKEQRFQVFIDEVMQPETQCSTDATVRRYDISSGHHVIEVKSLSGGDSKFFGFSLRVAQEPRLKYLKGNDSSQVVMQTTTIKPITYSTKYNHIPGAKTELIWEGNEAKDFELVKMEGTIADTFKLSGTAQCPVGEYKYAVVVTYNGIETSRATGKFTVASDIRSMTDINVTVYQNEEMDQIIFAYYALSGDDVKLNWTNTKPQGTIEGKGTDGKFVIGGTPTEIGTFPYEVSVLGADTIIQGRITVKELDYGENPVLYLCKHTDKASSEGIYEYLKSSGKWNPIERKGKTDGLRPEEQYKRYKWILISEDADANNEEVMKVLRGGSNLPILNMNAFTYAYLKPAWGEPDNGSLSDEGRFITVQLEDHPIFKALNKKRGDKIQVLDTVIRKGLMPININISSGRTLCLATALTRNDTNYYGDGAPQTILHEIPTSVSKSKKHICLPIAQSSSNRLTASGKKLIDAVINYLLNDEATIEPPVTEIKDFTIDDMTKHPNPMDNTIKFEIDLTEHPTFDISSVKPIVTLASDLTFVTPNSGEEVDFTTSAFLPVEYVVSDYIYREVYKVSIRTFTSEGLEEVYAVGDWINIYDIYGRKIATTNENIYTMSLPRGIYIIVTETGRTLKITR